MSSFSIIIPARLASTRFPNKVLYNIHGLPMIEHVRRRSLLVNGVERVVVATCDKEIFELVKSYNGDVLMTSDDHQNGTHRISEAANQVKSENLILLQGDEPCFEPKKIMSFMNFVNINKALFYNIICPIINDNVLYDTSSVKCAIDNDNIKYCFRKSPYITDIQQQKMFVYKMLGIMCFKRKFLLDIKSLYPSMLSIQESIEQLQLLDNNINMKGFVIDNDYPSINNFSDLKLLDKELKKSKQKKILALILNN